MTDSPIASPGERIDGITVGATLPNLGAQYPNAIRRLNVAIKQERDAITVDHKTSSERLEHLLWLHDALTRGDVKPLVRELTTKCYELVRNLTGKNFESRKAELIDRLSVIDELTRNTIRPGA